jgi:hypothetical protein
MTRPLMDEFLSSLFKKLEELKTLCNSKFETLKRKCHDSKSCKQKIKRKGTKMQRGYTLSMVGKSPRLCAFASLRLIFTLPPAHYE